MYLSVGWGVYPQQSAPWPAGKATLKRHSTALSKDPAGAPIEGSTCSQPNLAGGCVHEASAMRAAAERTEAAAAAAHAKEELGPAQAWSVSMPGTGLGYCLIRAGVGFG